jgi:tRNA pseudouridine38-40 synthase
MRIALGIEYDGSGYHGWQRQHSGISVQAVVEEAVGKVADHAVSLVCAGRTDAGVHATAQVVHFDTEASRDEHAWMLGSNSNLPRDVTVLWARRVSDEFHARFKAMRRSYRYVILNRLSRPGIQARQVTWWYRNLDVERMQVAAQYLLGKHDFSAFRAAECQGKTPVKTIHELQLARSGDWIYLDISADAFLHHMVRNIAGVLLAVGMAEQPVEWVQHVLQSRDRRQGGVTAPPNGLYLTRVLYPENYAIPDEGWLPRFG